jgi:hypothetical protein
MTAAFDRICQSLSRRMNDNDDVRRAVALVILRHVDQGESDPVRLSDVAFRELFTWHTPNRLIRLAFFFARAVGYWTRGGGTPSRAKACSCRAVGRASHIDAVEPRLGCDLLLPAVEREAAIGNIEHQEARSRWLSRPWPRTAGKGRCRGEFTDRSVWSADRSAACARRLAKIQVH